MANRAVRYQHGDIDLVGVAAREDLRRVDVDGDAVAAIGRRAEEARRDLADPPRGCAFRSCGSGNQVPLSVAVVCLRS